MIVVAGRNNFRQHSASLNALIDDLQKAGYEVCRLESRNTATARWLDDSAARLCGAARGPKAKVTKLMVLLVHPTRWYYVLKFAKDPNRAAARDLRRLIRSLPTNEVCLVSHSGGGIVSTLVASEESVAKIVCFGYPFKHPGRPEERDRTAHLPLVAKPFLILQGDQDDYGTADDARRYGLSSSTVLESIASGHDYDNLAPAEYRRCLQLVLDFLKG